MDWGFSSFRSRLEVYKPSTTVFATFFLLSITCFFETKRQTLRTYGSSGLESFSKRIHNIENVLFAGLKVLRKTFGYSYVLSKRHNSEHMPPTYRCDLKKVIKDLMREMSAGFVSSIPESIC